MIESIESNTYVFNLGLFRQIPHQTGYKNVHIAELCDVSNVAVTRWMQRGNIPVTSLVQICNRLAVPISTFINISSPSSSPSSSLSSSLSSYSTLPPISDRRCSYTFNPAPLENKINNREISIRTILKMLHCNIVSLRSWTGPYATVPQLLKVLNTLKWPASLVFNDTTIPSLQQSSYSDLVIQNHILSEEIGRLRQLLASIKTDYPTPPSHVLHVAEDLT